MSIQSSGCGCSVACLPNNPWIQHWSHSDFRRGTNQRLHITMRQPVGARLATAENPARMWQTCLYEVCTVQTLQVTQLMDPKSHLQLSFKVCFGVLSDFWMGSRGQTRNMIDPLSLSSFKIQSCVCCQPRAIKGRLSIDYFWGFPTTLPNWFWSWQTSHSCVMVGSKVGGDSCVLWGVIACMDDGHPWGKINLMLLAANTLQGFDKLN